MNTKFQKSILLFCVIAFFSLSSCSHLIMNPTIISSKSVSLKYSAKGPYVEGKGGTMDEAITNALAKAGNGYDAIIDGKVTMYHYSFVFIWVAKFKVEGTAIKTSETTATFTSNHFDQNLSGHTIWKISK